MKQLQPTDTWILLCSISVITNVVTSYDGGKTPCSMATKTSWWDPRSTPAVVHHETKNPKRVPDISCISSDQNIFEIMKETSEHCRGKDYIVTFYHQNHNKYTKLGSIIIDKYAFHNVLMKYSNWLLTKEKIDSNDKRNDINHNDYTDMTKTNSNAIPIRANLANSAWQRGGNIINGANNHICDSNQGTKPSSYTKVNYNPLSKFKGNGNNYVNINPNYNPKLGGYEAFIPGYRRKPITPNTNDNYENIKYLVSDESAVKKVTSDPVEVRKFEENVIEINHIDTPIVDLEVKENVLSDLKTEVIDLLLNENIDEFYFEYNKPVPTESDQDIIHADELHHDHQEFNRANMQYAPFNIDYNTMGNYDTFYQTDFDDYSNSKYMPDYETYTPTDVRTNLDNKKYYNINLSKNNQNSASRSPFASSKTLPLVDMRIPKKSSNMDTGRSFSTFPSPCTSKPSYSQIAPPIVNYVENTLPLISPKYKSSKSSEVTPLLQSISPSIQYVPNKLNPSYFSPLSTSSATQPLYLDPSKSTKPYTSKCNIPLSNVKKPNYVELFPINNTPVSDSSSPITFSFPLSLPEVPSLPLSVSEPIVSPLQKAPDYTVHKISTPMYAGKAPIAQPDIITSVPKETITLHPLPVPSQESILNALPSVPESTMSRLPMLPYSKFSPSMSPLTPISSTSLDIPLSPLVTPIKPLSQKTSALPYTATPCTQSRYMPYLNKKLHSTDSLNTPDRQIPMQSILPSSLPTTVPLLEQATYQPHHNYYSVPHSTFQTTSPSAFSKPSKILQPLPNIIPSIPYKEIPVSSIVSPLSVSNAILEPLTPTVLPLAKPTPSNFWQDISKKTVRPIFEPTPIAEMPISPIANSPTLSMPNIQPMSTSNLLKPSIYTGLPYTSPLQPKPAIELPVSLAKISPVTPTIPYVTPPISHAAPYQLLPASTPYSTPLSKKLIPSTYSTVPESSYSYHSYSPSSSKASLKSSTYTPLVRSPYVELKSPINFLDPLVSFTSPLYKELPQSPFKEILSASPLSKSVVSPIASKEILKPISTSSVLPISPPTLAYTHPIKDKAVLPIPFITPSNIKEVLHPILPLSVPVSPFTSASPCLSSLVNSNPLQEKSMTQLKPLSNLIPLIPDTFTPIAPESLPLLYSSPCKTVSAPILPLHSLSQLPISIAESLPITPIKTTPCHTKFSTPLFDSSPLKSLPTKFTPSVSPLTMPTYSNYQPLETYNLASSPTSPIPAFRTPKPMKFVVLLPDTAANMPIISSGTIIPYTETPSFALDNAKLKYIDTIYSKPLKTPTPGLRPLVPSTQPLHEGIPQLVSPLQPHKVPHHIPVSYLPSPSNQLLSSNIPSHSHIPCLNQLLNSNVPTYSPYQPIPHSALYSPVKSSPSLETSSANYITPIVSPGFAPQLPIIPQLPYQNYKSVSSTSSTPISNQLASNIHSSLGSTPYQWSSLPKTTLKILPYTELPFNTFTPMIQPKLQTIPCEVLPSKPVSITPLLEATPLVSSKLSSLFGFPCKPLTLTEVSPIQMPISTLPTEIPLVPLVTKPVTSIPTVVIEPIKDMPVLSPIKSPLIPLSPLSTIISPKLTPMRPISSANPATILPEYQSPLLPLSPVSSLIAPTTLTAISSTKPTSSYITPLLISPLQPVPSEIPSPALSPMTVSPSPITAAIKASLPLSEPCNYSPVSYLPHSSLILKTATPYKLAQPSYSSKHTLLKALTPGSRLSEPIISPYTPSIYTPYTSPLTKIITSNLDTVTNISPIPLSPLALSKLSLSSATLPMKSISPYTILPSDSITNVSPITPILQPVQTTSIQSVTPFISKPISTLSLTSPISKFISPLPCNPLSSTQIISPLQPSDKGKLTVTSSISQVPTTFLPTPITSPLQPAEIPVSTLIGSHISSSSSPMPIISPLQPCESKITLTKLSRLSPIISPLQPTETISSTQLLPISPCLRSRLLSPTPLISPLQPDESRIISLNQQKIVPNLGLVTSLSNSPTSIISPLQPPESNKILSMLPIRPVSSSSLSTSIISPLQPAVSSKLFMKPLSNLKLQNSQLISPTPITSPLQPAVSDQLFLKQVKATTSSPNMGLTTSASFTPIQIISPLQPAEVITPCLAPLKPETVKTSYLRTISALPPLVESVSPLEVVTPITKPIIPTIPYMSKCITPLLSPLPMTSPLKTVYPISPLSPTTQSIISSKLITPLSELPLIPAVPITSVNAQNIVPSVYVEPKLYTPTVPYTIVNNLIHTPKSSLIVTPLISPISTIKAQPLSTLTSYSPPVLSSYTTTLNVLTPSSITSISSSPVKPSPVSVTPLSVNDNPLPASIIPPPIIPISKYTKHVTAQLPFVSPIDNVLPLTPSIAKPLKTASILTPTQSPLNFVKYISPLSTPKLNIAHSISTPLIPLKEISAMPISPTTSLPVLSPISSIPISPISMAPLLKSATSVHTPFSLITESRSSVVSPIKEVLTQTLTPISTTSQYYSPLDMTQVTSTTPLFISPTTVPFTSPSYSRTPLTKAKSSTLSTPITIPQYLSSSYSRFTPFTGHKSIQPLLIPELSKVAPSSYTTLASLSNILSPSKISYLPYSSVKYSNLPQNIKPLVNTEYFTPITSSLPNTISTSSYLTPQKSLSLSSTVTEPMITAQYISPSNSRVTSLISEFIPTQSQILTPLTTSSAYIKQSPISSTLSTAQYITPISSKLIKSTITPLQPIITSQTVFSETPLTPATYVTPISTLLPNTLKPISSVPFSPTEYYNPITEAIPVSSILTKPVSSVSTQFTYSPSKFINTQLLSSTAYPTSPLTFCKYTSTSPLSQYITPLTIPCLSTHICRQPLKLTPISYSKYNAYDTQAYSSLTSPISQKPLYISPYQPTPIYPTASRSPDVSRTSTSQISSLPNGYIPVQNYETPISVSPMSCQPCACISAVPITYASYVKPCQRTSFPITPACSSATPILPMSNLKTYMPQTSLNFQNYVPYEYQPYTNNNMIDIGTNAIKNSICNYIDNTNLKSKLYNSNSDISIPLGNIIIAKKDTVNPTIQSINPSIKLKMWASNVKLVEAKVELKLKNLPITNFQPIVSTLSQYDVKEIELLVQNYIRSKYGDVIIVHNAYSLNNEYEVIKSCNNYVDEKCNLLWPADYSNQVINPFLYKGFQRLT